MRRSSAALFCLALVSCAEPPPANAAFACSGTLCPAAYECRQGYCFPLGGDGGCVRRTCQGDLNCGDISDGCGGTVACGDCQSPKTCGGGGTANVCGCTPETDLVLCGAFECGPVKRTDKCGAERMLQCGSCGPNLGCMVTAVSSSCRSCSPEPDGAFCTRGGATCGPLAGLDNCGKQRSVSCGSCAQPDGGAACLARGQSCSYDPECCDGRSCFNGRCERLDGGF